MQPNETVRRRERDEKNYFINNICNNRFICMGDKYSQSNRQKGYNIGKSGADGWFGSDTKDAVIAFQSANDLYADE